MPKFNKGDRVRSVFFPDRTGTVTSCEGQHLEVRRDDGIQGSGLYGAWTSTTDQYELLSEVATVAAKTVPASWDYAEAERLYRAVQDSIDAYNDYIAKKPSTHYPFAYKVEKI